MYRYADDTALLLLDGSLVFAEILYYSPYITLTSYKLYKIEE